MKKIFIFFLYVLGMSQLNAQDKIDKAIQNLEQNYPQEKVYLLLDKDKYVVGDHIYFKSFVFNGYNRSAISNTLLVELYDHNKNMVDKKTVFLKDGEGDGTFVLNDFLNEDIYFIRAYTTWMANFPEEFNFMKQVPIYNPNSEQKLVLDKNTKWTANAFPESGTFIENIPTKFAVRLYSQGTPPTAWSGYVIDSEKPNEKLTTFKNMDENVAVFNITPKAGKTYKAIVEDNKGAKQTVALPTVSNSGINLQLTSDPKGINYKINGAGLSQGLQGYSIIGTINNQLVYRANIKTTTSEATSQIPNKVSNDETAVLNITIFDEKQNVAAQRLFFLNPKKLDLDEPTLALSMNNEPRAFNSFDIEPDGDHTHYTVLVRENNPSELKNENTLLSAKWLTGDFTSAIFDPAQYFEKSANPEALDAILISEKWKRFDWESVLAGKTPEFNYKPQKNLSFKGKVTNNGRFLPNKNINLLMKTENSDKNFVPAVTDDNGFIYLDNIYFDEPLTVSYYLNKDKKQTSDSDNINLSFQALVTSIPLKNPLPFTNYRLVNDKNAAPDPSVAKALQNRRNNKGIDDFKKETLIEEVQVTAKKVDKKAELDKELSSGRFSSMNATIFDMVNENKDAQSSQNILQWLQGRAAGLTFTMDGSGNYIPSIRGSQASLFLDEMPVDASMINSLPISNIAMVKVMKNDGLVGNAVAIYTRRGNMIAEEDKDKEKVNKLVLKGYDRSTEFELPDITGDAYKRITMDTRETLYWNPKLSEEGGLAPRAKFFNNDEAKNRQIIIISFDKEDKMLYYDEIIK
ncbi:hypothetical protein [Epilithonimonas lactis]|uniref:TonB-dependent Receptor Plug Domain n=1 Tax=Epilithonimonas lactis TaxID=421072 RepID=A0A085B970_9FLAO|nr:hypothetical protein [Epilithonimonas lactis]KFC19015.1 hypothetical protein IO89_15965 [Epilithonimonas lactis]SEQ95248.1 hypothetical protein SAMN04488097_3500 [Epilithonimonas lactis]